MADVKTVDPATRFVSTSGAGVSVLPEPTVRREAESKRLVAIPLALPELVRPVGLIVRRNRPHGSCWKSEFCMTPAMARGCRACNNRARGADSSKIGSACTRQVTESGPNSPR